MEWIKVNDFEMPKNRTFIAFWKGIYCLSEYDEGHFYISFAPCIFFCGKKIEKHQEKWFTHWCELELPHDL